MKWLLLALVLTLLPSTAFSAPRLGTGTCFDELAPLVRDTGLPVHETIEIFGCRRLETGEWVEEEVNDERTFRRAISPRDDLLLVVEDARSRLLDDLNLMLTDRRFTQWMVYDIPTAQLDYFSMKGTKSVSLEGTPLWSGPEGLGQGLKQQYVEALVSFALDPDNEVIAAYAQWFIDRRDSVISAIIATAGLSPYSDQVIENTYHYQSIPWPWALADPYAIECFFIWVAQQSGM